MQILPEYFSDAITFNFSEFLLFLVSYLTCLDRMNNWLCVKSEPAKLCDWGNVLCFLKGCICVGVGFLISDRARAKPLCS